LFDNDFVQITSGLQENDLISLAPPRTSDLPKEPESDSPEAAPTGPPTKNVLAETRKSGKSS